MTGSGQRRKQWRFAFALAAVIIITSLVAMNYPAAATTKDNALSSPTYFRPVMARMYAFNQWSLPGQTPASVAQAISRMNASYVSGLIRMEGATTVAALPTLTSQMVSDFNSVRATIILASHANFPTATCPPPYTSCGSLWLPKFDIWLRPSEMGGNATLVIDQIKSVLSSGIYLDAISLDAGLSPQAAMTVCNYVHSQGKICNLLDQGSASFQPPNLFNPATFASSPFSPDQTELNATLITQQNDASLPVLVMISNGPTPVDNATGSAFHKDFATTFTYSQRLNIIMALVARQKPDGYALLYPVFWPDNVVGPPSTYYDSTADIQSGVSMLSAMVSLANLYNPYP